MKFSVQSVKGFVRENVTPDVWALLIVSGAMAIVGGIFALVNAFTADYPWVNYLPVRWVMLAPLFFGLLIFSLYALRISHKLAFFTKIYTLFYVLTLGSSVLLIGIQTTPFHPIDTGLIHFESYLGFSSARVMEWTAHHHLIQRLLHLGYAAISIEVFLLPFLLILTKHRDEAIRLLLACGVACLLGFVFYYFFPTTAPVSMIQSPYFEVAQYHTYLKFWQLHHYIQPVVTDGGMIAFPSFHVLFGCVFMFYVRRIHWLVCPIFILNILGILATVGLGWHYLTDVPAGILLSVLSIGAVQWFERRYHFVVVERLVGTNPRKVIISKPNR